MLSFLKVFARGIICTVLLPVILLVWVLYGVYCLIAFMVVFLKNIILFFAGENPTGDMKEDIEAKKILAEKERAQVEQAQVVSMMYQNMAAQQQMYGQPQPAPVQPAPQAQPEENDFDPFTPDLIEAPLPEPKSSEEQQINEGEPNDGQSY